MALLILMLCLAVQEADTSGQGTQKSIEGKEPRQGENGLRSGDLDALLRKVNALEAELKALKGAGSPQDKGKSEDPPAQTEEEKKKKQLEEEFRKALGQEKPEPSPNAPASGGVPLGGGATLKLIDLAFDVLATAGTSTATEDEIRLLQAGGHDPKNRGFTVQHAELTLAGVVDP